MKIVGTPVSVSYHDYLIESLKDPQEAAGYLEVVLEEAKDEPELLLKVLRNIMEAQEQMDSLSYEILEKIIHQSKAIEIYTFLTILHQLGFQLKIV